MYGEEMTVADCVPCLTYPSYVTVLTTMQLSASVTEEICRSIVKFGDTSQESLIADLDLASGCIQGLSPL